jgi:arginine and glutamate-rich protein 1
VVEEETAKRIELLVKKRVEEELEKRKDEIEQEVAKRVEEAKRKMEKEMMEELERQREQQRRKELARQVTALFLYQSCAVAIQTCIA